MRYYELKLIDWREGRIDAFIAAMFHGIASRHGAEYPHNEFYDRDSNLQFPLDIERNGIAIPDVSKPAENLVVAEKVVRRLRVLPGLAFFKARYIKLFHYSWKIGDFRHWKLDSYGGLEEPTPEQFIETMRDVPAYHRNLHPYYELLTISPPSLRKRYAFRESKRVVKASRPFSQTILEENSILDSDNGYYLTEAAFEAMAPFLDPDFYEWTMHDTDASAEMRTRRRRRSR